MNFDWENHYKTGGKSGNPSDYAISRSWKHNIMKRYYDMQLDSIIDVGCGDLQFWEGREPSKYTGIDISQTIVNANSAKHTDRKFICASSDTPLDISANTVICFDMLWHILDDDIYINTLKNIKKYSTKYIIIFTWNKNPFTRGFKNKFVNALIKFKRTHKLDFSDTTEDGGYQKYRNFLKIALPIFGPEFKLIDKHDNDHWSFGSMYIFKKVKP